MIEQGNMFATAFMVGYALPNLTASQSAHLQPKSPPSHKLSVHGVYFIKRKIRSKLKEKLPVYALSLLAGILHPDNVVLGLQTKEELQWELKLCKPIKLKAFFQRSSFKICKYNCAWVEFGQMKFAGILSATEKVSTATHTKRAVDCIRDEQASRCVERESSVATNVFKENGCRMDSSGPRGLPSHSPDEIQNYMRRKNQLRSKEKKAAIAQAQAAMADRKEKMKVLEMERRARLRNETSNGKERVETFPRPQWDSTITNSTGESNGPWSRSSYPVTPIDFPLPKPVDADGLSSLGLASKSSLESFCNSMEKIGNMQENGSITDSSLLEGAWLHAEGSQDSLDVVNTSHDMASLNKNVYQQKLKVSHLSTFTNQKVCSSHNVKSRSSFPVQSSKDVTKKMRLFLPSSRINMNMKQRHREVLVDGQSFGKAIPKDVSKYTLFQQAYHTKRSTPFSSSSDGTKTKSSFLNKQNASSCSFNIQDMKCTEKKLKVHANADGLPDRGHIPETNASYGTSDDEREIMPCHTQYLTYHLEKFPSRCKRESLTEKKRVALLKVLAQQLVIRLDAAESHPSYLLDRNVQTHAVSLRRNLEKFQTELHAAVKALEACYSQPPRKKSCGYIVLPSKHERKGTFQDKMHQAREFERKGLNLLYIEDALNNQAVVSNINFNNDMATASMFSLVDSHIPQTTITARQQRGKYGDSFEHKSSVSCKETNDEVLKAGTPNSRFQDLELRLRSICVDSKYEATYKRKRTWDHHQLDKELEKLDAEIKETKMRMARNLFSTHPFADTAGVISPLSLSPRCIGDATSHFEGVWSVSPTIVCGMERSVDLPILSEENCKYVSDVQAEPMGVSFSEKFPRQSNGFTPKAYNSQATEKGSKSDVFRERRDLVSAEDLSAPCEPVAELPSRIGRNDMTTSSSSLEISTTNVNMEACVAHPHVRSVEVSQLAPEPSYAGGLSALCKQGIKANQEILANSITEAVFQELLDLELSDMLLHCQDVSRSSQLRRMKKEVLDYAQLKSASTAGRLQHLSNMPESPCASITTSPGPAQEASNVCITGPLMTCEDFDTWNCQDYYDLMTMKSASPGANGTVEILRNSFKATSKRLVDKYMKEILEAQELLCASSLLEWYASGKTLSLMLERPSVHESELEEKLYGKLLLDALCECLDKKYLQFYMPSFFLFLQPCPDDGYLKRTLVNNVNEHADAACEGGFSLEYILEKSLDEEDWKTAHHEMVEVIHDVSEHVILDIINGLMLDLTGMKQPECSLQVRSGLMEKMESNCFRMID